MSVRLGGMYSGLDYELWIQNLVEVQRKQIGQVQRQKAGLEAKRVAWSGIRSALDSLGAAAGNLKLSATFKARQAVSSDPAVGTASAQPGAGVGNYTVQVTQLARAHGIASGVFVDPAAALNCAGTVRIGDLEDLAVAASDSLNSLRDRINSSSQALAASVVATGTGGYQLVITARTTGAASAITLADDPETRALLGLGVATGAGVPARVLTPAQDAVFALNSATYQRAANTVDDVVTGVTLHLQKEGTTTVNVSADPSRVTAAVRAFVDSYNRVMAELASRSAGGGAQGEAGPLAGDGLVRQLHSDLRRAITAPVAGLPESLRSPEQAGLRTGAWGTADWGRLVLDEKVLLNQLALDPEGVGRLFGAAAEPAEGVAGAVAQVAKAAAVPATGSIAARQKGLETRGSELDRRIAHLNASLNRQTSTLRAQFDRMEIALAKIRDQGNALLAQMGFVIANPK